jgi:hypothetical protein
MRLEVSFIAPRQLGVIGGQQGRLSLPSVEWRTRQSGAPPDSYCRRFGADLLPILAQTTVTSPGQMAHRTMSGAHRTVRCPPDSPVPPVDRWRGPRVARGLRGRPLRWRPLAHRTVRCTTGQSGELYPYAADFSRQWPVHRRLAWRTGHCPVHHQTVRCAKPSWTSAALSQVFCIPFLFSVSST